jgi:hypothetical protein
VSVAPRLDEPALPAATLDLPSAPIREAIARYRAAGMGPDEFVAVVDRHAVELEQELARDALAAIATLRAAMARWQWLRSFPNPARDLTITADLERELLACAEPPKPGPKPRRRTAAIAA